MTLRWQSDIPPVVLFDRDGTLVHDDPTLCDARRVRTIDGAAAAIATLRAHRIKIGVVTNQPRIGLGTLHAGELDAIHDEIDRRVGALDVWAICPHAPTVGCACRKPMPGLIFDAARRLGFAPHECVVIGDIGSDIDAAARAGARSILVPTDVTRAEEIARAPVVKTDLAGAVAHVLGHR
ncbi:MAG: hypothetical protein NVS2B8_19370 [Vulcanimicrobiaceae bacterium]